MSINKISGQSRYCATCTYWSGDRQLEPGAYHVAVDSQTDGKCLKRGAATFNTTKRPSLSCPGYEKWPVLR